MADGHTPTTSPTSFGAAFERPFLAEAEAIVAKQAETAARRPNTGVSWSACTSPQVEDIETVRARLVFFEQERREYLASPVGKARLAISRACRIAELNNLTAPYAALDAVGAALSRGDGTAVKAVERAQDAICKLPHGDVRDALSLLATELVVLVREVG